MWDAFLFTLSLTFKMLRRSIRLPFSAPQVLPLSSLTPKSKWCIKGEELGWVGRRTSLLFILFIYFFHLKLHIRSSFLKNLSSANLWSCPRDTCKVTTYAQCVFFPRELNLLNGQSFETIIKPANVLQSRTIHFFKEKTRAYKDSSCC